jgi:hypothetical protein
MLAIKIGSAVGSFVKMLLEGTFVHCWSAKLFSPILLFEIVLSRYGKALLPCIPYWG